MSKSIMIVICDFLLLSLLSLANFDRPKSDDSAKEKAAAVQEQNFADSQMVDLLKMSLDSERDRREALSEDVAKLSKAAAASKAQTEHQQKIIASREKELKKLAQTKEELQKERSKILDRSKELEKRVEESESKTSALQTEIVSTSTKLEKYASERVALEKRLGDMREVDYTTRMKLESVQKELRQSKEYLEKLRAESQKLKSENRAIESEKLALSTRLEVATTKTKIYEENLKRAQAMVDIEKVEKEKIREHAETLAVGVSELASTQKELSQEVKELRPKTASEIFEELKPSFVKIVFHYTKKSLIGTSESSVETRALPVSFGGKTWLVFSSSDTVLAPTPYRYEAPETLSVGVSGKSFRFTPPELFSLSEDPRMLAVEVPRNFLQNEKIEAVPSAENLFTFSDCVIINPKKFYYGQVPFRADFKSPGYAQMDVGLLQSVFGSFAPSEGDFAISRGGSFIGCMTGSDIAVLLKNITPAASLSVGAKYSPEAAAKFVEGTSKRFQSLQFRLK